MASEIMWQVRDQEKKAKIANRFTEAMECGLKKTGARLHIFHISTAKELDLFTNTIPIEEKQITAEVCIHHLWFTDQDYINKGNFIKWNPAVKTEQDREALWQALLSDKIDDRYRSCSAY